MPEKYPSPEDWATGRRLAAETRIIASTRRRSATIYGGRQNRARKWCAFATALDVSPS